MGRVRGGADDEKGIESGEDGEIEGCLRGGGSREGKRG